MGWKYSDNHWYLKSRVARSWLVRLGCRPHPTTPEVSSSLSPPPRCQQLFPTQNSGIGIFIKFISWSRYAGLAWLGAPLSHGGSGLDLVEGRRGQRVLRVLRSGPDLGRGCSDCSSTSAPPHSGAGPEGCPEAAGRTKHL